MFVLNVFVLFLLMTSARALPRAKGSAYADPRFTKGDGAVHKTILYIGVIVGCLVLLGLTYFIVCKIRRGEQVVPCIKARGNKRTVYKPRKTGNRSQGPLPTFELRDFATMENPYIYNPKPPADVRPTQRWETITEIPRKPVAHRTEEHWQRLYEESALSLPPPAKRPSHVRQEIRLPIVGTRIEIEQQKNLKEHRFIRARD